MKAIKKLLLALVPTIVVLLLFGLGFLACYYVIVKVLDNEIQGEAKANTLGRLLKDTPEKRSALASTYYDPGKALQMFDDISWAVPNIPTPFVGTAPTPGQHGTAHINSMQFRAAKELEMPKPADTYRIFITGGSTAFGSGAPGDDQTIAGYLNTILSRQLTPITKQKYEVLTMANRAWASTQERIVIENRLSELEPDMVISFSGVNDVHWGLRGRNVLWFRSYADEFYWSLIKRVFIITRQPPMPENTRIENPIAPALVVERLLLFCKAAGVERCCPKNLSDSTQRSPSATKNTVNLFCRLIAIPWPAVRLHAHSMLDPESASIGGSRHRKRHHSNTGLRRPGHLPRKYDLRVAA